MKDAFKIKRSLQYESLVDRSTKSKLEKKEAFFALWFLYYCCGGEGLKRHGVVVGRAFSPMKEPTIKEHLLIMMPRQNYLEKVGKPSFKFKPKGRRRTMESDLRRAT